MGQRIHLGCGVKAPATWRNFDAGPAFWLQKRLPFLRPALVRRGFPDYPRNIEYGDIVRGLPVAPGSADTVYCSHVLEHLALDECRTALRNIHTCLRPGGTFRLVVPDLALLVAEYQASDDLFAASRFMRRSFLGVERQPPRLQRLARLLFGRSTHLWMWDERNLAAELAAAGFTAIHRAHFGDDPDPAFADVENRGRWERCLGMTCRKP